MCYFELLSFDDFFGEEKFSWLPSKNKVANENLHIQRQTNLLVKLQCSVPSLAIFLEGSVLNFYSPKQIVKWKQVKITNMYDIKNTRTSGLAQGWYTIIISFSNFSLTVYVGIVLGAAAALLIITLVSCFCCSCCFLYKKRHPSSSKTDIDKA